MKTISIRLSLIFCVLLALTIAGTAPSAQADVRSRFLLQKADDDNLSAEQWQAILNQAESHPDAVVKKLVEWFYLRKADEVSYNFDEIHRFLETTSGWPWRSSIVLEAEKNIITIQDKDKLWAWFEDYKPRGLDAAILYADLLLERGQSDKARDFVQDFWVRKSFSTRDRQDFLRRFDNFIDEDVHIRRLDRLLWDGQFAEAKAMFRLVNRSYRQLAEARIKLARNEAGVDRAIANVPAHLKNDPGLSYERLKWRRKRTLNDRMMDMFEGDMPEKLGREDLWWRERHILIRRMLEKRNFQTAYKLAATHRQKNGFSKAQADWLAGWLALSFLEMPEQAYQHFETMYEGVSSPISRSRGAYWAGLAALTLGDIEKGKTWLAKSAKFATTFYGQLAYTKLQEIAPATKIYAFPLLRTKDFPNYAQNKQSFDNRETARAIAYLYDADLIDEKQAFFRQLLRDVGSLEDILHIRDLAQRFDDKNTLIHLSKDVLDKGYMMLDEGYPIIEEASFSSLVEPALIYGIIRQESAFDQNARSPVGALGLMQLMPATAKEVAGRKGVRFKRDWLTERPDYNIKLGSAYMQSLLERFDGYYILAIAAYNAGPTRIDNVMKDIGDPRHGDINIIDWIEMIPIYETRNYVQRVLEAMHVYRSRFQKLMISNNNDNSQYLIGNKGDRLD